MRIMDQIVKQTLDKYFEQEQQSSEHIFNQLAMYIYSLDSDNSDLAVLAKLLDEDNLKKLIEYYDGKHIRTPTKKKFQECLLVSLCFYLKEVKGWNWAEIKSFMDLPEKFSDEISMISLGGKINKIKSRLQNDLKNLVQTVPITEFRKVFLNEFQNDSDTNNENKKFIDDLCSEQEDEDNE